MLKNQLEYLQKRTESSEDLKYDFLPEMIEIIEKPAHPAGKGIIWTLFVLILLVVIATFVIRTDVIVTGTGTLQATDGKQFVQAQNAFTISEVRVSDGNFVHDGTVLVKSDDSAIKVDIDLNLKQYLEQSVRVLLYQELIHKEQLSLTQETDEDTRTQILKEFTNDLAEQYKTKVKDATHQEVRSILDSFEMNQDSIQMAVLQAENYKSLLEANEEQQKSVILNAYETSEEKRKSALSALNKDVTSLDTMIIVAEREGIISGLSENLWGTVLQQGATICEIVPDGEKKLTCRVSDTDIAQIKEGQHVDVKVNAYPYTDYGTIDGEVIAISEDASVAADTQSDSSEESKKNTAKTKTQVTEVTGAYYVVDIRLGDTNGIVLKEGMSATAEINVRKRSVIGYFLDSLRSSTETTFRQR